MRLHFGIQHHQESKSNQKREDRSSILQALDEDHPHAQSVINNNNNNNFLNISQNPTSVTFMNQLNNRSLFKSSSSLLLTATTETFLSSSHNLAEKVSFSLFLPTEKEDFNHQEEPEKIFVLQKDEPKKHEDDDDYDFDDALLPTLHHLCDPFEFQDEEYKNETTPSSLQFIQPIINQNFLLYSDFLSPFVSNQTEQQLQKLKLDNDDSSNRFVDVAAAALMMMTPRKLSKRILDYETKNVQMNFFEADQKEEHTSPLLQQRNVLVCQEQELNVVDEEDAEQEQKDNKVPTILEPLLPTIHFDVASHEKRSISELAQFLEQDNNNHQMIVFENKSNDNRRSNFFDTISCTSMMEVQVNQFHSKNEGEIFTENVKTAGDDFEHQQEQEKQQQDIPLEKSLKIEQEDENEAPLLKLQILIPESATTIDLQIEQHQQVFRKTFAAKLQREILSNHQKEFNFEKQQQRAPQGNFFGENLSDEKKQSLIIGDFFGKHFETTFPHQINHGKIMLRCFPNFSNVVLRSFDEKILSNINFMKLSHHLHFGNFSSVFQDLFSEFEKQDHDILEINYNNNKKKKSSCSSFWKSNEEFVSSQSTLTHNVLPSWIATPKIEKEEQQEETEEGLDDELRTRQEEHFLSSNIFQQQQQQQKPKHDDEALFANPNIGDYKVSLLLKPPLNHLLDPQNPLLFSSSTISSSSSSLSSIFSTISLHAFDFITSTSNFLQNQQHQQIEPTNKKSYFLNFVVNDNNNNKNPIKLDPWKVAALWAKLVSHFYFSVDGLIPNVVSREDFETSIRREPEEYQLFSMENQFLVSSTSTDGCFALAGALTLFSTAAANSSSSPTNSSLIQNRSNIQIVELDGLLENQHQQLEEDENKNSNNKIPPPRMIILLHDDFKTLQLHQHSPNLVEPRLKIIHQRLRARWGREVTIVSICCFDNNKNTNDNLSNDFYSATIEGCISSPRDHVLIQQEPNNQQYASLEAIQIHHRSQKNKNMGKLVSFFPSPTKTVKSSSSANDDDSSTTTSSLENIRLQLSSMLSSTTSSTKSFLIHSILPFVLDYFGLSPNTMMMMHLPQHHQQQKKKHVYIVVDHEGIDPQEQRDWVQQLRLAFPSAATATEQAKESSAQVKFSIKSLQSSSKALQESCQSYTQNDFVKPMDAWRKHYNLLTDPYNTGGNNNNNNNLYMIFLTFTPSSEANDYNNNNNNQQHQHQRTKKLCQLSVLGSCSSSYTAVSPNSRNMLIDVVLDNPTSNHNSVVFPSNQEEDSNEQQRQYLVEEPGQQQKSVDDQNVQQDFSLIASTISPVPKINSNNNSCARSASTSLETTSTSSHEKPFPKFIVVSSSSGAKLVEDYQQQQQQQLSLSSSASDHHLHFFTFPSAMMEEHESSSNCFVCGNHHFICDCHQYFKLFDCCGDNDDDLDAAGTRRSRSRSSSSSTMKKKEDDEGERLNLTNQFILLEPTNFQDQLNIISTRICIVETKQQQQQKLINYNKNIKTMMSQRQQQQQKEFMKTILVVIVPSFFLVQQQQQHLEESFENDQQHKVLLFSKQNFSLETVFDKIFSSTTLATIATSSSSSSSHLSTIEAFTPIFSQQIRKACIWSFKWSNILNKPHLHQQRIHQNAKGNGNDNDVVLAPFLVSLWFALYSSECNEIQSSTSFSSFTSASSDDNDDNVVRTEAPPLTQETVEEYLGKVQLSEIFPPWVVEAFTI